MKAVESEPHLYGEEYAYAMVKEECFAQHGDAKPDFKALTEADLTEITAWSSDESIAKWIYIANWHEFFHAQKDNPEYFLLGIHQNGAFVGELSAERIKDSLAVALLIKPERQGKGMGVQALRAFHDRVGSLTGVTPSRIHAAIFPGNHHSVKCFERAGYIQEGTDADGALGYVYRL